MASLTVLILDILTKFLIVNNKPTFSIPGFNLVYVENTGALFGLGSGFQYLFILVAFLVLWGVYYYRDELPKSSIALGLVVGGTIGNLLDRMFRGFVVDFLDFYVAGFHWPAFNIADAALVVGVIWLVLKKE